MSFSSRRLHHSANASLRYCSVFSLKYFLANGSSNGAVLKILSTSPCGYDFTSEFMYLRILKDFRVISRLRFIPRQFAMPTTEIQRCNKIQRSLLTLVVWIRHWLQS